MHIYILTIDDTKYKETHIEVFTKKEKAEEWAGERIIRYCDSSDKRLLEAPNMAESVNRLFNVYNLTGPQTYLLALRQLAEKKEWVEIRKFWNRWSYETYVIHTRTLKGYC